VISADRLLPIIEGLQAYDAERLALTDFLDIDAPGHRLQGLRELFWAQALKDAAGDENYAGIVATLWETFGELLPIGFDTRDGPIYVAKISATPQHIVSALEYTTRPPQSGEVLQ
jgi:hypothetical protein